MTMDRRDFLKTGTLLTAGALSGLPSLAAPTSLRPRAIPLNRGWRYFPAKVDGAHKVDFNDEAFEHITIPHTNVKVPWHDFDDNIYEFISTYRRRFKLPAGTHGKRILIDFEGAMLASTVWINGVLLGEYRGGFTPFSFELTPHIRYDEENVLVVQLDSTERPDIPPFGNDVDYLTFGGIYREVSLRVVPATYLDNIFAHATNILSGSPGLDVDCFLAGDLSSSFSLEVELRDGDHSIRKASESVRFAGGDDPNAAANPETPAATYTTVETQTDPRRQRVSLQSLRHIQLWNLDTPHLYSVYVRLLQSGRVIDEDVRRIGFREATFTDHGFSLNGMIIKLRGLDRHQTFPFAGQAMPARVQRKDAKILREDLHCNIVRTSHYPQSRHFLDCCDEIGLLVLEEIPGWQHIGPEPWKQVAIDNVGRMIRRDWNHPSIILWGVRINESGDDHSFYLRTNALAHLLDPTRQTGGIRNHQDSELLEDVFTMNDFGFPLKKPNHPRYLNTEFVGHTYPTKTTDDDERQREHTLRHARIHNQLASDPQYAGGIGWCAFDYHTHADFGSGDRICYHGVLDIFREPKAAAGFYKSQCDPAKEIVLEPAFHWANSDESTGLTKAVICSNCEHLKLFIRENSLEGNPWLPLLELDPERTEFEHLAYPPFIFDHSRHDYSQHTAGRHLKWGDLRIDGYLQGKIVASRSLSGSGVSRKFTLTADDLSLMADGADTTRVVLRVTDEFGAIRPYANDAIVLKLEGAAELIGENPLALVGGRAAVWVRAMDQAGTVKLTAIHAHLGLQEVEIAIMNVTTERV
jgi:beta-galactosidase